jgi:hypothetical protein
MIKMMLGRVFSGFSPPDEELQAVNTAKKEITAKVEIQLLIFIIINDSS